MRIALLLCLACLPACGGQLTPPPPAQENNTSPADASPDADGQDASPDADAPDQGLPDAGDPDDGLPPRPDPPPDNLGPRPDPNLLDQDRLFTCAPDTAAATPSRLWRISPEQFQSASERVMQTTSGRIPFENPFSGTRTSWRFQNPADEFTIEDASVDALFRAPRPVLRETLRDNKIVACIRAAHANNTPPDVPCQRAAIQYVGERLFRRPLSEEELTRSQERMAGFIAASSPRAGIEAGLALLFTSPEFLFRDELGAEPGPDGRALLTPMQLVGAVAFALGDEPPDAQLLQAARDGSILDREQLRAHVRRLLKDKGSNIAPMRRFIRELFGYHEAPSVFKERSVTSGWRPGDLVAETDRFVVELLKDDVRVFALLLTSDMRVTQERDVITRSTYPDRFGILSHRSWLVAKSHNLYNDPIKRGKWVRETLLAQRIPAIPIDVVPQLPPMRDDQTMRERLHEHSGNDNCTGCHQMMDPLGLPFERYEHHGEWRDTEAGRPVDTSGEIKFVNASLDGPVADHEDLAQRLADSPYVQRALLRHLFRFTLGRDETYRDACSLSLMEQAYNDSNGSLAATLEALILSDSFPLQNLCLAGDAMNFDRFKRAASRRTFLKGLGLGAAGALLAPTLQRLEAEANGTATPTRRVLFVVEGNGFYGFRDWRSLTMAAPTVAPLTQLPAQVAAWQPYADRVALLNGLANKQGIGFVSGHQSTFYALTCMPYLQSAPGGPSIDSFLAQTAGAQDIFPSIRLAAGDAPDGLRVVTSARGPGVALPSQHSVHAAYSELFGVVAQDQDVSAMFSERGQMLDYMTEDIQRVLPKLAAEERWKFERYLYAVETFQLRQQRLSARVDALAACAPAQAPPLPMSPDVSDRLAIQLDLATLAFVCGLTRVATISAAAGVECHSTFSKWGHVGKHSLGHGSNGGPTALIDIHNRVATLLKGVADQLAAVPEGDGTMLDNTAIIFLNDNGSEHHSYYDNFPVAILGDLGGRLKSGISIEYPHRDRPGSRALSELWNTVCHAMGVPKDDFAKEGRHPSRGPLPELLA